MIDHDDLAARVAVQLEHRAEALRLSPGSLGEVRRRARQRHQRRLAGVGTLGLVAAIGTVALVRRDDTPASITPATTVVAAPDLRRGDSGEAVRQLQETLKSRGYDPGAVDGVFGEQTEQAVWAFEGAEMGRQWQDQTGVVDETFRLQLEGSPAKVAPRRNMPTNHMEIHLDTQVLVVFHGIEPVLITHISSGDGKRWCETVTIDDVTKNLCGQSVTPGGVFEVYRRSDRLFHSSLGDTNKPVFFNYDVTVGGAVEVPKGPASHGVVRIPMAISEYFPGLVDIGDTVYVWDGTHEPEDVPRAQTLPVFPYPDPG